MTYRLTAGARLYLEREELEAHESQCRKPDCETLEYLRAEVERMEAENK